MFRLNQLAQCSSSDESEDEQFYLSNKMKSINNATAKAAAPVTATAVLNKKKSPSKVAAINSNSESQPHQHYQKLQKQNKNYNSTKQPQTRFNNKDDVNDFDGNEKYDNEQNDQDQDDYQRGLRPVIQYKSNEQISPQKHKIIENKSTIMIDPQHLKKMGQSMAQMKSIKSNYTFKLQPKPCVTKKKKADPVTLFQQTSAIWKKTKFLNSQANIKEGRKLGSTKSIKPAFKQA